MKGAANDVNSGTPPLKQGADLIGLLCGVSDESIETAKRYATQNGRDIRIISEYDSTDIYPYSDGGIGWTYAYPVPKERLEGLIRNLEKETS